MMKMTAAIPTLKVTQNLAHNIRDFKVCLKVVNGHNLASSILHGMARISAQMPNGKRLEGQPPRPLRL